MRAISRKGLIAKVDKLFSLYVRMKHADEDGFVRCVTCGSSMRWQDSQAGHFVRRGHYATRWHEKNVHPQDARCNLFLGGAMDEHAAYIIRTYGVETFDELMALKRTTKKYTAGELRELIDRYEEKVCQL
jgi:hypothetical protein